MLNYKVMYKSLNLLPNITLNNKIEHIPITMNGMTMHVPGRVGGFEIKIEGGAAQSLAEVRALKGEETKYLEYATLPNTQVNEIEIVRTQFESLDGLFSTWSLKLVENNHLVSFQDIHKHLKGVYIRHMMFEQTVIRSNMLGLILCDVSGFGHDDLGPFELETSLPFVNALMIVQNHIQNGRDMLECQEELILKGYKDYARL